jgi:hypothetical protein
MLTSVKMVTGVTSKTVIKTGKSKTLMPASTATYRIIENTKHIALRTNTTLCHFSNPEVK